MNQRTRYSGWEEEFFGSDSDNAITPRRRGVPPRSGSRHHHRTGAARDRDRELLPLPRQLAISGKKPTTQDGRDIKPQTTTYEAHRWEVTAHQRAGKARGGSVVGGRQAFEFFEPAENQANLARGLGRAWRASHEQKPPVGRDVVCPQTRRHIERIGRCISLGLNRVDVVERGAADAGVVSGELTLLDSFPMSRLRRSTPTSDSGNPSGRSLRRRPPSA